MVILDTSVWIEFFKGNEPYFKEVLRLIESRSVVAIEPVFGELLQGALNTRERDYIISFWDSLSRVEISELLIKAGNLSFAEKLVPKGVQLIDAGIIYSTVSCGYKLWTLDKKIIQTIDNKFLFRPRD